MYAYMHLFLHVFSFNAPPPSPHPISCEGLHGGWAVNTLSFRPVGLGLKPCFLSQETLLRFVQMNHVMYESCAHLSLFFSTPVVQVATILVTTAAKILQLATWFVKKSP